MIVTEEAIVLHIKGRGLGRFSKDLPVKPAVKKMSVEEIGKELGYEIKVVKS